MKIDGWTEGRYNSFITSTLRAGMRRWPPKWQALKESYVDTRIGKSGRKAKHYKCAGCLNSFPASLVEIDHVIPVVDPKRGFRNWDEYIDRLFCSVDNLQVLCKPCHKMKTSSEKATRSSKTLKSGRKKVAPSSTATRKARSSRTVSPKTKA